MPAEPVTRIHIVGAGPRTGTTLLAEMMTACFHIPQHSVHEDRIFRRPPDPAKLYLTKCPRDIMVIRPALWADPGLYVICLMRDPRDTVCSRHGKNREKYWSNLNYWNTYIRYWRRIRSHPRFMTIRYEELVRNPDAVQQAISARLPQLVKTASFSSFHEHAHVSKDANDALGGIRPVSTASIGCWRDHLPRLAGQLRRHGSIAGDLIEFGYETDDAWLQSLAGIKPDFSPGHLPEFFTWRQRRRLRQGIVRHVAWVLLARARRLSGMRFLLKK